MAISEPVPGGIGPVLPYPADGVLHEIVAAHAAARPEAVALRWRRKPTTYGELQAAAERASAVLAGVGVRGGDLVAVRARCVPDMVATLLAVLRLGAAYTVVPPEWPWQRYAQLLAVADVRYCVSEVDEPRVEGVRTLGLDELMRVRPVKDAVVPELTGDAPCVAFFTSGSTGLPKAVLAPHRGIARIALDPASTVPGPMSTYQVASIAWDGFAWELWAPLLNGGTCVLSGGARLTGSDLAGAIGQGVNAMFLNTVLFNAMVDDDVDSFRGLELLITGGERNSPAHFERAGAAHPGLRLTHAYGPAESTIFTTCYPVPAGRLPENIPIGTAVTNTTFWLLDEERRPVPPGETGEIVIGGDGLAIGYVGNEAETARRFPTLELDGIPTRVYATGDLGRFDADGQLVFVGRKDRQIKIRGTRIEPGEVERALEKVDGVERAVVLGLPPGDGPKTRLAGFYRVREPGAADEERVRKELTAMLPAAFVPAVLHGMETFPQLTNGKIDYAALVASLPETRPAPQEEAPEPAAGGRAAAELAPVLAVVSEILGRQVGPDEDLFDSGATSMTAIRIATRLARLTGRPVSEVDVLTARTSRRITALEGTETAEESERAAPAAVSGRGAGENPLFSLEKFWRMADRAPDLHEGIMPMLFVLSGQTDVPALRAAVDAVIARHDILRTRFWHGPRGLSSAVLPADQVSGVLAAERVARPPRAEAVEEAIRWLREPFGLSGVLPIRARLLPTAEGEYLLAVVVHHIALDAWSSRLLCTDIFAAYREIRAGRPAFTTPAPSFGKTFQAQRRAQLPGRADALRQWTAKLAGVPVIPFPGAENLPWYGDTEEVDLPLTAELVAAAGRAGAVVGGTSTAVFFAAYVDMLRAYTGSEDIAVCAPVSGRFLPETEEAVGCYASMLALRLPRGLDDPVERVRAAASELRAAMTAPLLSIDLLSSAPQDAGPRNPLLQAYFVIEEVPKQRWDLGGGHAAEQIRVAPRTWIPELTLELRPHPDLGGLLRYRTDALTREQAARFVAGWLDRVRALVEPLTRSPGTETAKPLETAKERR